MRRTHALALAVVMTMGLAAQARAQVEVGVKGGLTFATISENNLSPDFKSRTGFAAGVHFGIPLGKTFLIQPEALITQQGAGVSTTSGDADVKLTYLQVPLNLRLNFGSGSIRPFILGGPYAAFKLSCNVDTVLGGDCDDLDIAGTDFGLDFGGGIRFGNFFVEARYNLGLKNVSNLSEGFDSKQRVFMAMVGIAF